MSLQSVAGQFQISGRFMGAEVIGSGHINDTYASTFDSTDGCVRYVHQRINHHVFPDPVKVMENIERVTRHARQRIEAAGGDPDRETLSVVPAHDGQSYHRSAQGEYWRTYRFIEGARTYDTLDSPQQLRSSGQAFANFQHLIHDLPGDRLHETIPDFHHTPKRFQAFLQALSRDAQNRAHTAREEIEFILRREPIMPGLVQLIEQGAVPERIAHNDTKLNNVMIDDQTGHALCVIDLDTVMPGTPLFDFGDSIRLGASTAAEDERDLDQVKFSLSRFDLLAQGYLATASRFLTETEIDHLALSAIIITLECGMRFLTDHLEGDRYFRTSRVQHNLDRARTQLKMVAEMERHLEQMQAVVNQARSPGSD